MKIKKLLVLEALLSFLIKRCVYSGPLLGAFRTLLAGSGMLTVKTGSVPDPFQKVLERCQFRRAAFRTLLKRVWYAASQCGRPCSYERVRNAANIEWQHSGPFSKYKNFYKIKTNPVLTASGSLWYHSGPFWQCSRPFLAAFRTLLQRKELTVRNAVSLEW